MPATDFTPAQPLAEEALGPEPGRLITLFKHDLRLRVGALLNLIERDTYSPRREQALHYLLGAAEDALRTLRLDEADRRSPRHEAAASLQERRSYKSEHRVADAASELTY